MTSRTLATAITALLTLAALLLLVERGGVLAWVGTIFGALLLAKIRFKPGNRDATLAGALAATLVAAWVGTYYYVISTWESGEVTELAMDTPEGVHTARVWVLDVGENPVIYYDAEPEIASLLLAGNPLQFTRDGNTSTRTPKAVEADGLAEDEAGPLLEAMQTKYGERNSAATLYYGLLGRSRDRVAVVAELLP